MRIASFNIQIGVNKKAAKFNFLLPMSKNTNTIDWFLFRGDMTGEALDVKFVKDDGTEIGDYFLTFKF